VSDTVSPWPRDQREHGHLPEHIARWRRVLEDAGDANGVLLVIELQEVLKTDDPLMCINLFTEIIEHLIAAGEGQP
jgi:hypothetical protein